MNDSVGLIASRRLRAPRKDGQALLDPSLADEANWVDQNVALRRSYAYDVQGCSLVQLASDARHGLLRAARHFTACYRNLPVDEPGENAPVILVGHQPALVHPGVWFKNFVLSELATRASAHAVHLLCDNDAVRATSIRVPGGSLGRPTITSIPLDRPANPMAYEQRPVLDKELFCSFGQRVVEQLRPLVRHPLIEQWWPLAIEAMRSGAPLGEAIARARHILEGQWGLSTLEVPLGRLCKQPSFQQLALHLLCEADRFRAIHNEALAAYRVANRVRSHTHPVPDLGISDGWTEVPFWLWTDDQPARQAAFVRRSGGTIQLTNRASLRIHLPMTPERDLFEAVDVVRGLEESGVHLRPRALLTTMFARLLLGDVFIHGIGGAKYDELTDTIIRHFLGIEPPAYLIATMTARLPVPCPSAVPEDVRRVDQLLRQLEYHPERHVDRTPEAELLIEEKRRLIASDPPRGRRRERHRRLERVNTALRPLVARRSAQLLQERQRLQSALRSRAILDSREYAFCLFPETSLRPRLLDLSRQEP